MHANEVAILIVLALVVGGSYVTFIAYLIARAGGWRFAEALHAGEIGFKGLYLVVLLIEIWLAIGLADHAPSPYAPAIEPPPYVTLAARPDPANRSG